MSSVLAILSATARVSSSVELVPSLGYGATRDEVAWPLFYYTTNGLNLFGVRDVDQYDVALRGTVTFTRAVSLQFFTQVFLAQGRYRDFRELSLSGGQRALETLVREGPPFVVSGLFALHQHTGIYRETKDLDVLLKPSDVDGLFQCPNNMAGATGGRSGSALMRFSRSAA